MHPRKKAQPPTLQTVEVETVRCFEQPSQESAEFSLKRGMAAVVFYIKPEFNGNCWREGTISVAVVSQDLILIRDAMRAMQDQGNDNIAVVVVEDDIPTLNELKKFIQLNTPKDPRFARFHAQLQNQNFKSITVEEEKLINLKFVDASLKIEYSAPVCVPRTMKDEQFSLKKIWLGLYKPVSFLTTERDDQKNNKNKRKIH